MRTNVVLNDDLVNEAFKYSTAKTKRQLIDAALREYVQNHGRLNLADLRGKIAFRRGYNYKRMRRGGTW